MAETGMVGYLPRPAEPFVFSFRNFPSCKMLTDILHVMGIFMGGRHNQCMGSLAAGQIDKHGNINSTIMPGVTYITGSGGANDITSSSREVVVCLQQSPRRFVDKVPYITAPGRTVRTVVSDLGVYEKTTEHGELTLTGLFGEGPEAPAVQAAREACGWELRWPPRCAASRRRPRTSSPSSASSTRAATSWGSESGLWCVVARCKALGYSSPSRGDRASPRPARAPNRDAPSRRR